VTSIRKRKRRHDLRTGHERALRPLVGDAIRGLMGLQPSSKPSHGFAEIQPPKLHLKRLRATLDARGHPPCVVIDPEIMSGTPCLAGSRLPAQTLLDMVDGGDPWERLVEGWPWLTPEHVNAARRWFADGSGSPPGSFACRGCSSPVLVRGSRRTLVDLQYCAHCEGKNGSVG
jgi:uncharacterized protein (DUF433 family)